MNEVLETYTTRKLTLLIDKTEQDIMTMSKEVEKQLNKIKVKKEYLVKLGEALNKNINKPISLDESQIIQELRADFNALPKAEQEAIRAELEADIKNCNNDEL